jgi:hypothetical protein
LLFIKNIKGLHLCVKHIDGGLLVLKQYHRLEMDYLTLTPSGRLKFEKLLHLTYAGYTTITVPIVNN